MSIVENLSFEIKSITQERSIEGNINVWAIERDSELKVHATLTPAEFNDKAIVREKLIENYREEMARITKIKHNSIHVGDII